MSFGANGIKVPNDRPVAFGAADPFRMGYNSASGRWEIQTAAGAPLCILDVTSNLTVKRAGAAPYLQTYRDDATLGSGQSIGGLQCWGNDSSDGEQARGRIICVTEDSSGRYHCWRFYTTRASVSSLVLTISSVGVVTAAAFAGAFTGDVTGNCSGSSGSCTGLSATATALATARALNGVDFNGTAPITIPVNNADDTATNATFYLLFTSAAGGNYAAKVCSTKLGFNPSTGLLTLAGSLALNGGSITSTAATVNLFAAGPTTVNFAREASLAMGTAAGTTTIYGVSLWMPNLPTTNPGAGKLWYDPTDTNRLKMGSA